MMVMMVMIIMIMITTIYACEFEIEALGTLEPDLIETQSILKY